jgi:hypothetical protein
VFFKWIVAPAGLVVAYAIVEHHFAGKPYASLASCLSGVTIGFYFGLLVNMRRNSSTDDSPEAPP